MLTERTEQCDPLSDPSDSAISDLKFENLDPQSLISTLFPPLPSKMRSTGWPQNSLGSSRGIGRRRETLLEVLSIEGSLLDSLIVEALQMESSEEL